MGVSGAGTAGLGVSGVLGAGAAGVGGSVVLGVGALGRRAFQALWRKCRLSRRRQKRSSSKRS